MNRVALTACVASFVIPALSGCFDPETPAAEGPGTDGSGGASTSMGGSMTSPASGSSTDPTTGSTSLTTSGDSTTDDPTTSNDDSSSTGDPPVTCEVDGDCDDGQACNGEERCNAGICAEGSSPCPNPDPVHCVALCAEGGPGPACGVGAADLDGDGEGSDACKPSPGLDCDDDNDQVYSTADEVCDGFDNDCNGLADIDDGLPLFGTPAITGQVFFADLAYSPQDEVYGVAYDVIGGNPMFTSYDLQQNQVAAPTLFPDDATDRVFLEWSGETFAGVYRNGEFMLRQAINANGLTGNPLNVSGGGVGFTYGASELADGGLAVGWTNVNNDDFFVRFMATDLGFTGNAVTVETDVDRRAPRFARLDDTIAHVWQFGAVRTELGLYDVELGELARIELTDDPTGSIYGTTDVGLMGDGFAVAYATGTASQRVEYVEYEVDGTLRCGPITLTAPGSVTYQSMDADGSTAVVYATVGDDWTLHRVREGCETVDDGVVIETVSFYGEIGDVDINASGIGVVTQIFDDGGANPRMSFRALGPNLCDAPVAR